MELQNFEKSMHQKFQDFEPEVNDLKIWDAIESKIPQKKKRRAIFWLCWIGLPFMFLSLLAYLKFSDSSSAMQVSEKFEKETTIKQTEIKQHSEEIQTDHFIDQNESTLDNGKQVDEITNKNGSNTSTMSASIQAYNTDSNKAATNSSLDNLRSYSNEHFNISVEQIITDESKAQNSEIGVAQKMKEQSDLTRRNHQLDQLTKKNPRTIGLKNMKTLPLLQYGLTYKNDDLELDPIWFVDLSPQEEQKKFKAYHAIGLELGYGKMFSDYQSVNASLLDLRRSSETPLDQASIGLIYKYQLTNKISLQSGLNFWQANWQSIHATESQEVLSENFQQITRTHEISYKRYGKDRALSIPILLEYDFFKKEKFSGRAGLGYEFNLFGSHKGYEIDLNGQEYNIENDIENRYLNKSGNYLMANVGAGYNINERTLLQINMTYKYGLNTFQTQASSVQKSYRFLSLNAGILKRIN